MSTIASVLDAIEQRLATVPGLRTYDFAPDAVSPPAAIVSLPSTVDFDMSYGRGADKLTLTVRIYVSSVTDRGSRYKLSGYLDPSGTTSIKQAVEGTDETLGGVVQSVRVVSAQGIGIFTVAGVDLLGCDFTVEVFA